MPQVASDPKVYAPANLCRALAAQPNSPTAPRRVTSHCIAINVASCGGSSATHWWHRLLEPERHEALYRHDHHQGFERSKCLHRNHRVDPGTQNFTWNGRGNDGRFWPDGSYTLTATAVDANNQSVAISTEVEATVDSVDSRRIHLSSRSTDRTIRSARSNESFGAPRNRKVRSLSRAHRQVA